jgi:hypothetical protein
MFQTCSAGANFHEKLAGAKTSFSEFCSYSYIDFECKNGEFNRKKRKLGAFQCKTAPG